MYSTKLYNFYQKLLFLTQLYQNGVLGETRTLNEGVGGPCFIQLDYEHKKYPIFYKKCFY